MRIMTCNDNEHGSAYIRKENEKKKKKELSKDEETKQHTHRVKKKTKRNMT